MATALDEIIAGRAPGEHRQTAHHRFIVTIFGIYARPAGRALKVSTVIELMSELGHEPASVRSSISRLKKKGVLVPQRMNGAVGYALTEELEPHMLAGDERIFSPRYQRATEPWLMVSYSVPEAQRKNRQVIRTGLARLGFGTVIPGLSIAPEHLRSEVMEYMSKHDVDEYVDYFSAEPVGLGGMRQRVAQWWDLETLEEHYRKFVDLYEKEIATWSHRSTTDLGITRHAFQLYIPLLTHWRRLPYLDPGLPIEFLPDNWMGIRARRTFMELHRSVSPLAAEYVKRTAD